MLPFSFINKLGVPDQSQHLQALIDALEALKLREVDGLPCFCNVDCPDHAGNHLHSGRCEQAREHLASVGRA